MRMRYDMSIGLPAKHHSNGANGGLTLSAGWAIYFLTDDKIAALYTTEIVWGSIMC